MKAKNVAKFIIALLILCFFVENAFSENENAELKASEIQKEIQDEETRQLGKTEKPGKVDKDFMLDYGAWVFGTYANYKDIDNNKDEEDWVKDYYCLDIRVWMRATYKEILTLYGRIKNKYAWRPNVSSDYDGIGDDYEGPSVDIAYGDVNLWYKFKVPFSFKVGRQYLTLGRGITYSDINDGVELKYIFSPHIKAKAFLSKTKPFDDNIDYSVPNYQDENNRHFYGAEVGLIFQDIVLYGYGLVQRDYTHECPDDLTQNYTYDSEYLGFGLEGKQGGLGYWGEVIKEFGKSNTDGSEAELAVKDINAWALDLGTKYEFNVYSHPLIEGEFMYGSGDKDRERVTNTRRGNLHGKDTNFLYFGVINAGYALAPRISNMLVYKIGLSAQPFEVIPYVGKRIAVGSRYYVYQKDKESGGIYDIDATESKKYVGQELDLFFHWNVYENFSIVARYGIFFPGDAYPEGSRDCTTFLYTRATMTF